MYIKRAGARERAIKSEFKSNWGIKQMIECRQKIADPKSAGKENFSVNTNQDLHAYAQ